MKVPTHTESLKHTETIKVPQTKAQHTMLYKHHKLKVLDLLAQQEVYSSCMQKCKGGRGENKKPPEKQKPTVFCCWDNIHWDNLLSPQTVPEKAMDSARRLLCNPQLHSSKHQLLLNFEGSKLEELKFHLYDYSYSYACSPVACYEIKQERMEYTAFSLVQQCITLI